MIDFIPNPECDYKFDYEAIFRDIADGGIPEVATFRQLCLEDLWFILCFVMEYKDSNDPFVVQACKDVESGPDDYTLDLWARGHFKSSILTKAETIQDILKDPEERIGLFSHTRPAAKSFLREIMQVLEMNQLLKAWFPDVLYENPGSESPKWSEDDGLIVRRKNSYTESTLEAWGLIEGMPTGRHFTKRKYDDIETRDLVQNPDAIVKLKETFNISQNLKSKGGKHRVIGTPYHHAGLLQHLREAKDIHGRPMYKIRVKAATVDGTPNGAPVFLSQDEIDKLKVDEQAFNSQQLLNPTPVGVQKLNSEFLKDISPEFIPAEVYKFMVIDPAGDSKTGKGDAWAIHVIGVEPKIDDLGASNIYITDSMITPMRDSEAIESITRMYLNGGMIMQLGVEKVGLSSVEVHVANALRARGRSISTESGTLVILRPGGRSKVERVQQALEWPLNNNKMFISTSVPAVYRDRLRAEMDKFPYWHDDGLDALAYLYDMIKDYRFARTAKTKKVAYKEMGVV